MTPPRGAPMPTALSTTGPAAVAGPGQVSDKEMLQYYYYINHGIDTDHVGGMDPAWVQRIMAAIDGALTEGRGDSVQELWQEVNDDYSTSVKKVLGPSRCGHMDLRRRSPDHSSLIPRPLPLRLCSCSCPLVLPPAVHPSRVLCPCASCTHARAGNAQAVVEFVLKDAGKEQAAELAQREKHATMHTYAADLSEVPTPWSGSFHAARVAMYSLLHLASPMPRFALRLWNEAFVETQVRIVDTRKIMARKEAYSLRDFLEAVDKDAAACLANLKSNWIEVRTAELSMPACSHPHAWQHKYA